MSGQSEPVPPCGQAGGPVVIDVAKASNKKIVVPAAIAGFLGVYVLVSVAVGAGAGVDGRVIGGVVGGVCLLVGLTPVLTARVALRPRKLIVTPAGLRWDDPKGRSWSLPWSQMSGVAISTVKRVSRRTTWSVTTGGRGGRWWGGVSLVRLDLWPGDAHGARQHPRMRHLWEAAGASGRYRLPLGPNPKLIPALDNALRAYAPPGVYRGLAGEGITVGLRYT